MFIPLLQEGNDRVWGINLLLNMTYVRHPLYLPGIVLELPVGMGSQNRHLFQDMPRMQREIQALLIRELPIVLQEGDRIPWFTPEVK